MTTRLRCSSAAARPIHVFPLRSTTDHRGHSWHGCPSAGTTAARGSMRNSTAPCLITVPASIPKDSVAHAALDRHPFQRTTRGGVAGAGPGPNSRRGGTGPPPRRLGASARQRECGWPEALGPQTFTAERRLCAPVPRFWCSSRCLCSRYKLGASPGMLVPALNGALLARCTTNRAVGPVLRCQRTPLHTW